MRRRTCLVPRVGLSACVATAAIWFCSCGKQLPPEPIGSARREADRQETVAGDVRSRTVTLQGIVTQTFRSTDAHGGVHHGLALQNTPALSDGDPGTSDAIYVGLSTNGLLEGVLEHAPLPGDEVTISGRIGYSGGRVCLRYPRLLAVLRRGLDVDREVAVFEADPPANAAAAREYWRQRDAMRCRAPAGCTVQGAYRSRTSGSGWIQLLCGDHPLNARTNVYARRVFRDAHPLDDVPETRFDNGNGFVFSIGEAGLAFSGGRLPSVRTFDVLAGDIVGAVLHGEGMPAVHIATPPEFVKGPEPCENLPRAREGRAHLTVSTFNVENLFDHRDDPFDDRDFAIGYSEPGVTNLHDYVPGSEAKYRQRLRGLAAQIVSDLGSPDILLLQEIEDQDVGTVRDETLVFGRTDNCDGRPDVLQELAIEIRRAGGPAYDAACDRAAADNRGIVCAFLYRENTVRLSPPARSHPVMGGIPEFSYEGVALAHMPRAMNPKALNAVFPGIGVLFHRGPQVARFEVVPRGGGKAEFLYAINNHFKSRPDADVALRSEDARYNAAIAAALLEAEPGASVIVGGDLNVFPRPDEPLPDQPGDQLGALYDCGLTNLYDVWISDRPEGAYTYVYNGQAQTLDHLFVSPDLSSRLLWSYPVHINSDYAKDTGGNRGVSDHDPVVAGFERW